MRGSWEGYMVDAEIRRCGLPSCSVSAILCAVMGNSDF